MGLVSISRRISRQPSQTVPAHGYTFAWAGALLGDFMSARMPTNTGANAMTISPTVFRGKPTLVYTGSGPSVGTGSLNFGLAVAMTDTFFAGAGRGGTMHVLFRVPDFSVTRGVMWKGDNNSSHGWALYLTTANRVVVSAIAASNHVFQLDPTLSANEWYLVTITSSGANPPVSGSLVAYINGAPVSATENYKAGASGTDAGFDLKLGQYWTSGGLADFKGDFAMLAFARRQQSDAEVLRVWNDPWSIFVQPSIRDRIWSAVPAAAAANPDRYYYEMIGRP